MLPAQIDPKLHGRPRVDAERLRHALSADGAGAVDGANQNELTDVADRDPFTGIPHHRVVPCRIEPAG